MSALLDQFFAPTSFSAASSGAPGNAHAGVDAQRLDFSILAPFDEDDGTGATPGADAWDTVWLGEIPLPPIGTGKADIKIPVKIKVDKAAKTGAAKPKVKNTGGEAIEGTITVRFVQEALPAMVAAAVSLYPGSGPFPVRHPKATMAKLDHVEITGWADAPDPDEHGIFTWTLNYLQVALDAQNGAGGSSVKTPKTAKTFIQPGDTDSNGDLLDANGDVIPTTTKAIGSNGNTITGFVSDGTAEAAQKKSIAKLAATP